MRQGGVARKTMIGKRHERGLTDGGVRLGYERKDGDRADRNGPPVGECRSGTGLSDREKRRERQATLGRCAAIGPRGNGARGGEDWAEASADRREMGVGLRVRLGCGEKKRSRPSGIIRERENFSFLFYFQNQFKCKTNQF